MTIQTPISKINRDIIGTFALLDSWFDRCEMLEPCDSKPSPRSILEHVMLTNRDLLPFVENGLDAEDESYARGISPGFEELKPGHHSMEGIRSELRHQLYQCLCFIETAAERESVLCDTGSSKSAGVDQRIYVLIRHAQRHLADLDLSCAADTAAAMTSAF